MFSHLIIICLGCAILNVKASPTSEDFTALTLATLAECEKETGARTDDLIKVYIEKQKPSEAHKCLETCVAKKLDIYKDGKISSKAISDYGKKVLEAMGSRSISESTKLIDKAAKICSRKDFKGDSDCDPVYKYIECLVSELKSSKLIPNL